MFYLGERPVMNVILSLACLVAKQLRGVCKARCDALQGLHSVVVVVVSSIRQDVVLDE